MKLIVDGENAIFGRLGSFVAKELLKGNEVIIINSEKVIISGSKKDILDKVINLRRKGGNSMRGPKISRIPEKFLKRKIRGMLPWDRPRGREVYRNLKCYVGTRLNEDLKDIKKFEHKKPLRYLTIKQITDNLK